jgi:hypothetical protein
MRRRPPQRGHSRRLQLITVADLLDGKRIKYHQSRGLAPGLVVSQFESGG